MKTLPTQFDGQAIRRVYDEATETWWFSVVDVVQVLTGSSNARRYWSDLKRKLAQEAGSEQPYEKIVQMKLPGADGRQRLTDCANAATLLRVVQSIPSPKAEPIKLWLAKVGYERMQEMADPGLSLDRARETWQKHGRSDKWIQQRMTGQETRNKLTDYPLRRIWSAPATRKALLAGLADKGFGREPLAEMQKLIEAERSDLFDVLAYVAFAAAPLTRAQRAVQAKLAIATEFSDKQQAFVDFVLAQYVTQGVDELDTDKLAPLLKLQHHNTLADALAELGQPEQVHGLFVDFQRHLYARRPAA